jgi:hypothetical protein
MMVKLQQQTAEYLQYFDDDIYINTSVIHNYSSYWTPEMI